MRKIPNELKEEIHNDPFYKRCCLSDTFGCNGKIEWHHNLIYAGKQVNEKWCILPLCKRHHDMEKQPYIKEKLNHIMLQRATDKEISPYCKAINYLEMKQKLSKIYGK